MTLSCCICEKWIKDGMGHNPAPLKNEGACCDYCNANKVLPERLKQPKSKSKIPLERTRILIDSSVLKDMFEGKNEGKSKDCLNKMKEMKDKGIPLKIFTTQASFLRAIFLANSEVKIKEIQKALSFLVVAPSNPSNPVNFKDEKAVMEEIITFAKVMSHFSKQKIGENKK